MAKKSNNNNSDTIENSNNVTVQPEISIPIPEVVVDKTVFYKVKVRKAFPNYTKSDIPKSKSTCMLVSRLNNPVYISYGSSSLLLPPRSKISDLNPEMLGSLPKGIDILKQ